MAAQKSLTDKQRLFIAAYLENGLNATRAAQAAGYQGDDNTLQAVGFENLRKPAIRAAIDAALRSKLMGADEAMARWSEQARASLEDFIDDNGQIDLKAAKEAGKLHLIHKLRVGAHGDITIELHDQQAALTVIAKYHKLLTEQIEVNWRKEAEEAGLPLDDLFASAVEHMKAAFQKKFAAE